MAGSDLKALSLNTDNISDSQKSDIIKVYAYFEIFAELTIHIIPYDRNKIIKDIQAHTLLDLQTNFDVGTFPWYKSQVNLSVVKQLIQNLSNKLGYSVENFLIPPCNKCLDCNKPLTKYGRTAYTQVLLYTCTGVETASKISYHCAKCKIVYKYDQFGNDLIGFRFYEEEQRYVKATNGRYIERLMLDHWQSLRLHAQISFDSAALRKN